ncbi:MAG: bifunctional aspartate kinase/diaminopimelate decarboxylase [Gammaproteobacteria bacterium]|nr:bifunctional aspartate kinase/diaminopimelate decarboxylase [Gammaproteobacteria bacterium]
MLLSASATRDSARAPLDRERWIVLKFGGTSVSRRERWDTIGRLARERAETGNARVLVVVSALSGVTNALQAIADGATDAAAGVAALQTRHRQFAAELGLDADFVLGPRLAALQALASDPRATKRTLDWQADVLAQGELLSSTLGAAYLGAQEPDLGWCDARDWLDAIALPNQNDWSTRLSVSCRPDGDRDQRARFARQPTRLLITQGFIARHPDGGSAILGRGGSDTSAAYFGALLGAERVEIWTDVPGMFSANPREVPDARLLTRLDYAEAQEIATTGARVLHPRSIAPCRDAGVPIAILDTGRPDLPGTRIDGSVATVPGVKAISSRRGIVLVAMESIGMWQQVGFLADVFERFKRHGLSVDLIGSSETNVTVSLDPSENLVSSNVLEALSADLAEVCRVKVIAPCAAITLVGRGMRSLLHRLSDIWAAFGRERVHLISQSSNDLNLTFVVDEADAEGLIPQLHAALIRSGAMPVQDTGVFGPSWREITHGRPQLRERWWAAAREPLLQCAQAGTPRYVYDLATVRERARMLAATPAIDRCFYAVKANAHPAILRAIVVEGFGLECVSQGELDRVFETLPELPPQCVLFTPSFAPRCEYEAAFARGVTVTLDNIEALQRWPEVFRGRTLWLRLDLGHGEGHHEKVRTGGVAAKFGLPIARFDAFLAQAHRLDIHINGLHAHLGSGIDDPRHWRGVYAKLAGLADNVGTIESIDIGGGLPVAYTPDAQDFDLQTWRAGLDEIKAAYPRYGLVIEPGRYLVAESGVLLLTVTQVIEKDGVRRVGGDGGMNALMRPTMYDAYHGIHNLSRLDDDDTAVADVVGPICESSDVLGRSRPLPKATAEGDVLLVADTGAYGMAMANTYNLRALPAEDIIEQGGSALLQDVYVNGLGEFAYRNGLDLHGKIRFPSAAKAPVAPALGLQSHALVAIGGGKDSLVSIEALRSAGIGQMVAWIGGSQLIAACAARTGLPTLNIGRQLAPQLFDYNRQGAWNGHIPVTAVNSAILAFVAVLRGVDQVVFSNEHSASYGSLIVGEDGSSTREVNHQWSKGWAFERAFGEHLQRHVAADLQYYSLLRPLSELAVARQFARSDRYDAYFSSCNRNFHILGERPVNRWCGVCPKCHFVFLALAPFMPKPRLTAILGRNLLDDPAQTAGYDALLEYREHKPFECVGEGRESRAAMAALAQRPEWREDALVERFAREIRPQLDAGELALAPLLEPGATQRIPPALWNQLRAHFAA